VSEKKAADQVIKQKTVNYRTKRDKCYIDCLHSWTRKNEV